MLESFLGLYSDSKKVIKIEKISILENLSWDLVCYLLAESGNENIDNCNYF